MEFKGLTLDKFQEDAVASIEKNHSVVVSAPTGSGKTLIADYIINKYLKKGVRVIYTAPIKALSNQKYKEFSTDYGEKNVGLLTGDIVKNPGAPILIMTTEIFRNMALINDPMAEQVSYVIFDEIHFINDIERGYVWEESIIFSKPHVRFLCLSATIPNAREFADWIKAIKEHEVDVIKNDVRNVPLERSFYDTELGITTLDAIKEVKDIPQMDDLRGDRGRRGKKGKRERRRRQKTIAPSHIELVKEIMGKLPCFFFCFSRKKCENNSLELSRKKMFHINTNIISFIRKKLSGTTPEINQLKTTRILKETLPYGIGFHHAGLLPIMKELVEELFSQGLIKVLYTTETFAVGINMPAKTVCFEALRKFDGISFRFLNSKEYFQIAGRAGRRGIDKQGFAYAMIDRRDFDYPLLKKITEKDVDPIKSQFKLSVNTVLNLIKQHNQEEIDEILCKSFHTYQKFHGDYKSKKDFVYNAFNNIKRKLIKMGYVEVFSLGGTKSVKQEKRGKTQKQEERQERLTNKGEFSSKIYADEILLGEMFSTDFYKQLNEFQILMVLACICYEPRERTQFFKTFGSADINDLWNKIRRDGFLVKQKQFRSMRDLTALMDLCYHGKNIFEILLNTSLSEGDVIRFFRQILDRIGQMKNATEDHGLKDMLRNCQTIIDKCMEDIDVI